MFLVRLILESGMFVVPYLCFEVVVPYLWDKPIFPLTRRLFRIVGWFIPEKPTTETLLDASTRRLANARIRLRAAEADLAAAELEQKALSLEDTTNDLREKGKP
jgi:hypothetical protein